MNWFMTLSNDGFLYKAHIHLYTYTLMNLWQFCTLGMTEGLNDRFMQLRTPWWWASEARNKLEFAY